MKHSNPKKDKKIENFPKDSIDTAYKTIEGLLSFNFKYLDSTQGQTFSTLTVEQFSKIMEKLKWYSTEKRFYWEKTAIGHGKKQHHVLEVYGDFPSKSEYVHPAHVPAGVKWARFRLEGDQRLIGFVVDKSDSEKYNFNPEVFYVVFLDLYHKFYISDN